MDPIRVQVQVDLAAESAFARYTEAIGAWWPRSHHIGEAGLCTVTLEPRAGGRIYQTDKAGTEHTWSTIREWDPPHGFVASWELGPTFEPQSDPDLASEFRVSFVADPDPSTTTVTVEHRDFARHGTEAGSVIAAAVGQANGWPQILAYFKRHVSFEEPPTRAGELATLTGFLDYFRHQLIDRAFGLSDEQLQLSAAASTLTLSRLIGHMALVELGWFKEQFAGHDIGAPFDMLDFEADRDAEMTYAQTLSGDELVELFWNCVADSRTRTAAAESLDQLSAQPHPRTGEHRNLRWIMVHMIEEYARHCGHADLIREAIDGDLAG